MVAPDGYYNIYRENKIENILNLKPNGNKSQDSYYPDVCSKAVKNKEGVKSFILSSFPLSTKEYANVIVTKGM